MLEDNRLDRIEQKLDKLTEAVSQIARVEEQMLAVFKRIDRHEKRLDDQEDDIQRLTEEVLANSYSVKAGERVFWIGIATVASVLGYLIR
jgi:uncharacterized protein (UPF0335 family)